MSEPEQDFLPPRKSQLFSKGLAIDFPMRPEFLAQVLVPADITRREAERLCAMIMTLPLPPSPDAV